MKQICFFFLKRFFFFFVWSAKYKNLAIFLPFNSNGPWKQASNMCVCDTGWIRILFFSNARWVEIWMTSSIFLLHRLVFMCKFFFCVVSLFCFARCGKIVTSFSFPVLHLCFFSTSTLFCTFFSVERRNQKERKQQNPNSRRLLSDQGRYKLGWGVFFGGLCVCEIGDSIFFIIVTKKQTYAAAFFCFLVK